MRAMVLGLLFATSCAQNMGAPDDDAGQAGSGGTGFAAAGGSAGGAGGGSSPASGAFVEVACDKASTVSSQTTHYAEVSVSGLRPNAPPKVTAVTCTADAVLPSTDGGAPQTHTGDPDPSVGTCAEAVIRFGTDRLFVICGFTVNGTPVTRYSKAYVRVE